MNWAVPSGSDAVSSGSKWVQVVFSGSKRFRSGFERFLGCLLNRCIAVKVPGVCQAVLTMQANELIHAVTNEIPDTQVCVKIRKASVSLLQTENIHEQPTRYLFLWLKNNIRGPNTPINHFNGKLIPTGARAELEAEGRGESDFRLPFNTAFQIGWSILFRIGSIAFMELWMPWFREH